MKTVYFAGGCFWCITAPIAQMEGVIRVESGYSGGEEKDAVYLQVKHQLTEHREAIKVTFDESVITYQQLLNVFFENIDPFDGEGQFIDRGRSYTTAIYYQDDEQKSLALKKIKEIEEQSGKTVCVSVEPFRSFYLAEEEHQDYYKKNPLEFEKELIESGRK